MVPSLPRSRTTLGIGPIYLLVFSTNQPFQRKELTMPESHDTERSTQEQPVELTAAEIVEAVHPTRPEPDMRRRRSAFKNKR